VNAGTPAGTLANPWLVALGVSTATAWANFSAAINNSGTPGTQYSTALTAHRLLSHADVGHDCPSPLDVGWGGRKPTVTLETGAAINWGAGTLTGGGAATFTPVETPDGVGIISLPISAPMSSQCRRKARGSTAGSSGSSPAKRQSMI
jgi:hypothetical protein